jgi:hypothetical protein
VGQPALGAALGLRDWIIRDGSRAAIRAALPSYLKERGITRQPLASLTGSDALKPGEFDAEGFTIRFLEAVTRKAEDAHSLLWTMEREWCGRGRWYPAVSIAGRHPGGRRRSTYWRGSRSSRRPPA